MEVGIIVVIVLLVILVIFISLNFKKMLKLSSENYTAWKNLDVELKKRLDFIPVLNGIIRSYNENEKLTIKNLEEIEEALDKKMVVADRQKTEDKFSAIFKYVFDSTERYPDLKASHTFEMLRVELTIVEQEIEKMRREYNTTTRNFNAVLKKFPYKPLSHILGYKPRFFFEVDLTTKEEVVIDFIDRRKSNREKEDVEVANATTPAQTVQLQKNVQQANPVQTAQMPKVVQPVNQVQANQISNTTVQNSQVQSNQLQANVVQNNQAQSNQQQANVVQNNQAQSNQQQTNMGQNNQVQNTQIQGKDA